MERLYDALHAETQREGGTKPIVLRPHVGEGANDVAQGRSFHRDHDRQIVVDKHGERQLSHVVRARENIDALLHTFEARATQRRSIDAHRSTVQLDGIAHHRKAQALPLEMCLLRARSTPSQQPPTVGEPGSAGR